VLAYVLQMASFLLLRRNAPSMARPFTSRLGIPGALTAAGLALLTLAALFANPEYRIGVWGAAVWFVCGVAYFAVFARHRLIVSPEEDFALALASTRNGVDTGCESVPLAPDDADAEEPAL